MAIRAQSADGKIHEFPDGTDRAVVDRVMKGYATKQRDTAKTVQGFVPGINAVEAGVAVDAATPKIPTFQTPGVDPNAPTSVQNSTDGYRDPLGMLRDGLVGTAAKATQGATLGFGDEIAGIVSADARDAMRAEQAKYEKINPIGATVAELGGTGLTAFMGTPAALARPLGLGGRLARGASIGAAYGGLTGFGNAEGGLDNRLSSAGLGAAVGGVAGLGAEALAPVARRIAFGAPPPPQATPQMLAANNLPVPVPLTRGQATGNTNLLGQEYALAADARSGAGPIMRGFADEQNAALLANRDAIQQQLAGNSPVIARGQGGEMVSARLGREAEAARSAKNAAYDEAERLTPPTDLAERPFGDEARGAVDRLYGGRRADVPDENFIVTPRADLPQSLSKIMMRKAWDALVRVDVTTENALGVKGILSRFGKMADEGGLPIANIFQMRRSLTSLQSGIPSATTAAAGAAKTEIDTILNHAVEKALLGGDTQAIAAWNNAIAANRDFARTYKGKDFVAALTERDRGNGNVLKVKPEEAANYILGNAEMGLINKRDLAANLARLRAHLGEDSAEWGAVKQEAFIRIADQALGAMGPTGRGFSGAKLAKAWEDINHKAPETLNRLFSGEERREIGNWIDVARRVTVKEGRVFNSSGSGYRSEGLAGLINRGAARIPGVSRFWDLLRGAVNLSNAGRAERMATEAISGVPPAIRAPRPGVPAALLAQPAGLLDYRSNR